ncbi:MAG TPA: glycosyltransferase, partial [Acidimicrobiales bacterium]
MKHLLVTNDFPPKLGGIQSYLWELWRRLPADEVTVLTTPHPDAAAWDAAQPYRIERTVAPVLLPGPALRRQIDGLAAEVDAGLVVLDPALPLGMLGPSLERPYGIVIHGAEVTVPGRTPGFRAAMARVLRGASTVIAAGGYPADEAERAAGQVLPITVVPPGVDHERFRPLSADERVEARARFDLPVTGPLVT